MANRPIPAAIEVTLAREKDILGGGGQGPVEGAKFWLTAYRFMPLTSDATY